ncbi:LysE family transporter [Nevskia sp.]|uniref:LysE family transporter n=1 Tax=Nevskia sp. TaxID=1929292 RepID=UPI0025DB198F|nr:LysE family transporter [Nevskia sp.]
MSLGTTLAGSGASLFATVAVAHALAVISPGPDLAVVTRQTLAHGRRAGVLTALGIAAGISFHVAYGLFGLAFAIERFPALLTVLQLIGAALLLWIGWGAIRAQPLADPSTLPADDAARAAAGDFSIGLATNLLNVKAMLFFVALCSALITGATPLAFKFGMGVWMIVTTGIWFSFVAWTLGHPAIRRRLLRVGHWIDRVMGALLIVLGIGMLASVLRGG